jgi:hypothetical protein
MKIQRAKFDKIKGFMKDFLRFSEANFENFKKHEIFALPRVSKKNIFGDFMHTEI